MPSSCPCHHVAFRRSITPLRQSNVYLFSAQALQPFQTQRFAARLWAYAEEDEEDAHGATTTGGGACCLLYELGAAGTCLAAALAVDSLSARRSAAAAAAGGAASPLLPWRLRLRLALSAAQALEALRGCNAAPGAAPAIHGAFSAASVVRLDLME